jgi:hypothetical protein
MSLWETVQSSAEFAMTTTSANLAADCLYCGRATRRFRKGEHIIPKAIGGGRYIADESERTVCEPCNNGLLSVLDRELCNRSPLSIIASQEIAADLWQVWDVDHSSRNLLIEAKPSWHDGELKTLVQYPQMTIELRGPELRGDGESIMRFGPEDFQRVMVKAIRGAVQRYNAGESRVLHFERLESDIVARGYRFAPRIFTKHSISEIARNIKKQSFILRYESENDKRYALRSVWKMEDPYPFNRWATRIGSHLPTMGHSFDLGVTLRAFLKVGINLLAAYCTKTPVNCESFKKVIDVIRGDRHVTRELLAWNGFVTASEMKQLAVANRGHSFRLVHLDGEWLAYSSFFGGRIGSVARFPGPNLEDWRTLDVVAPLFAKEWSVTRSAIIKPIIVHVEWQDLSKLAPSVKLQNVHSAFRVEPVRVRR